MIMKKLIILVSILLICVLSFSACSSGSKSQSNDTDEPAAVATTTIGEDEAKAIAFEDAGITETAAEELTVADSEVKGEAVYVISFKWSGFDYQYSISKASGEIVKEIFDGEVMN